MGDNEFLSGFLAGQGDGGGNKSGGFFGGDMGAWIFAIIIIAMVFGGGNLFGGGGGWGNGGGAPVVVSAPAGNSAITEGFALNNIINGIQGIQRGQCDSTYALNNAVTGGFHNQTVATLQGFNGVQQGFCDIASKLAECCCENRAAIADLKYAMANQDCATRNLIQTSTRDIIDSNNAGYRAMMDYWTNDKISMLRDENQALRFQASQNQQNQFIAASQTAQTAELLRRLTATTTTTG